MNNSEKTVVILGPTCSWKSQAAVEFAKITGREIISCDSMQVYRGLEIGTAQPSADEMAAVRHHMVGIFDISEPYDANIFMQLAKSSMQEINGNGHGSVIVGGTGMYARALVYGHSLLPSDVSIFHELQLVLDSADGKAALEEEICRAAGGRANVPKDILLNPRHLLRACEVLRITGRTPWELNPKVTEPSSEFIQAVILPELELLKGRIRIRTRKMLDAGWIEEAQLAIGKGLMETPTARQALGYRDIAAFLAGDGPDTEEELCTVLANRTIQYARRQITWFKHQHPGANFINISSEKEANRIIVEQLINLFKGE